MNCVTIDTIKYVGIDIGKRICAVCIMDSGGNVLEQMKYKNTREDADKLAKTVLSKYGTCSAVCESTSKMWMKTYEAFEEHRIPIILGNPIRMKMAQSGVKTDKLNARKLADRLRMNAVPECYVYPKESRRLLDLMRHRITLVRDRTRVLNRQSSLCERYDYELVTGHGNTHNEKHQQLLEKLALNSHDTKIMMQYVQHVRYLNGEIDTLEKSICGAAYENKDARTIMSIPGFGPLGALLVAAPIDGIKRFDDPQKTGIVHGIVSWSVPVRREHQIRPHDTERRLQPEMDNDAGSHDSRETRPASEGHLRGCQKEPPAKGGTQHCGQQDGQIHLAHADQGRTIRIPRR